MKFSSHQPIIVKKSPIVIVQNFIALQLAAMAAFFLAGIMANYAAIYRNFNFSKTVSYHVAEALFIFSFEVAIVFYIFFSWYKEYYEFNNDKIVHAKGVLFRHKRIIPLEMVYAVSYSQGPLGKLTKYGTINLQGEGPRYFFKLAHIPEPRRYTELITDFQELRSRQNKVKDANSLEDLIPQGENERLEFKSSFRWDLRQNKVNKNLEKSVMKTIAAFLNSDGGYLVIGVDDERNIVGMRYDYESLPKQNSDSFENHFTNVFHMMIGPELRQFVKLSWHKVNNKDFCIIKVVPSNKPAYLKADENEEFFIRTGNGTTALKLSEAASYIDSRWSGNLL